MVLKVIQKNYWLRSLSAVLAGLCYTLGYAPVDLWPLMLLALALLFFMMPRISTKAAFAFGFLFGLGMYGLGISWMHISISTYGQMPWALAALCVFLLIVYMSLFPAIACALMAKLCRDNSVFTGLLLTAPVWMLFEWLRSWLLTGLPWLLTAYPFLDTPLIHWAPIGGAYLVGFAAAVSAYFIANVGQIKRLGFWCVSVLVALIWFGGYTLSSIHWTQTSGEALDVAIIQNNNSISMKWDPERSDRIVQAYIEASQAAAEKEVDLVVWPEAAIPYFMDQIAPEVWSMFQEHPSDFVFGALERQSVAPGAPYYNVVASSQEQDAMIYRKQQLVPFGEFFPAKELLQPLIDRVQIPVSDFSAWTAPQPPIIAAGIPFAVSICYEDAFPEVWRDQVGRSKALLNVSEDSWFGDSLAPHQRLQMARFRSKETERPMVRSSNNGLSTLINWRGDIDVIAPQFTQYVLYGQIQPRIGVTPYVAYGNLPVVVLLFGLWLIGITLRKTASDWHEIS